MNVDNVSESRISAGNEFHTGFFSGFSLGSVFAEKIEFS